MALGHMKRHSGSLLIKETWIKTTTRYHFHLSDRQRSKSLNTCCGEKEWGHGQSPHTAPGGWINTTSRRILGQQHQKMDAHPLNQFHFREFIRQIYSHTCAPWCMFKVTHRGKTRHNEIFISRGLALWIMAHPHHRLYTALKRRRQPFMDQ